MSRRDILAHASAALQLQKEYLALVAGVPELVMVTPTPGGVRLEYTGRVAAGIALPTYCSKVPVDMPIYGFANRTADSACDGYIQTVYYKSCALLAGVRSRLGATAFAAAMREIVSTYRGKVITEADVVAIFEGHATNRSSLDHFLYSGFLTPPPAT